ncbi:GH92 family glycosyl hydrolase [Nocardioides sp. 503]|uniref:GH92 family glycosyl hydrolase n=1 Tax=Nocardioides sp. 503 TaxID=2508326 RepID=UPI00106F7CEF|nr:GH92 family glycosyl hydrolase [Nocardioides sp. 503]
MSVSVSRRTRTSRVLTSVVATALSAAGLAVTVPAGATAAGAPTVGAPTAEAVDHTQHVNPFMSTQGDHGQNLPGAQVPHGLAKPNPATAPGRTHSGYDYAQSSIKGFTLTNLDGVGGSGAGGDVLVVPTYRTYTARPAASTYALPFSHDDETAEPGYYQVGLQASEGTIDAELTATVRSGLERFTFPKAGAASVVFDLQHNFTGRTASELTATTLADGRAELSGSISGTFNGYAYRLFYDAVTDVPVTSVKTWGEGGAYGAVKRRTGTDTGAVLTFDVDAGEAVQLTTTLSPVSVAQARRDRTAEIGDRSFEQVRQAAHDEWRDTLGKVAVTSDATADPGGDLETIFYTSLYRMLATPTDATSTDGTYRGVDGAVHRADGYTHYDGWGTWDDFRKYPVLASLYPDVYADVVQSLVDVFADDAAVGSPPLSTRTMAVPTVRFERASVVIADAVAKGVRLDRLDRAYPAVVANAGAYSTADEARGYVPGEPGTTVGNSYDDYALSVIARSLGKDADADRYAARALNYRNSIKPGTWTTSGGTPVGVLGFRSADGTFTGADPERFEGSNPYQGSLWQYHWYPAQDVAGLVAAMGGTNAVREALSHYFGEEAPDDGTRMLKSNANEVDLHTPYLFNYVGQPAKTQKWVRDLYTKETWQSYIATGQTDGNTPPSSGGRLTPPIRTKVFKNDPEGFLPTMDDDTGAMSATFVAAAVGLYPVTAGSSQYQVGSPFFPRVDVSHADGTTFSVTAEGVSADRFYVQDARLDGKAYANTWLDYADIVGDGAFDVTMGSQPSQWGTATKPAFSLSTAVAPPAAPASIASDRTTLSAGADGAVDGTIAMTLTGATFAGSDGDDLVASGRVRVAGLPEGVAATVTRTSSTTLSVHVAGTLPTPARASFAVLLQDGALGGDADESAVTGRGLSTRDPFVIRVTDHWRAELEATYAEARLVVQGNYEGSTYAAMTVARDAARTALADTTATDEQLNDAQARLAAALDGLTLSQGGFRRLEAEQHDSWSGGTDLHDEPNGIGGVRPGDWIAFRGISFGEDQVPDQVQVRYSGASDDGYADAAVEVRLGAVDGPLLATVATPPTATGFGTYATATADLTGVAELLAASPATVYFVFRGSNTDGSRHWVGNFDRMQFADSGATDEQPVDNDTTLAFKDRTEWGGDTASGGGAMKTESFTWNDGTSGTAVANTHDGDWLRFAAVDIEAAATSVEVHYVNNSNRVGSNVSVDVHLDSRTSAPLVTVPLPVTGTAWDQAGTAKVTLPSSVTGTHDIFLVLHATTDSAHPYAGNFDHVKLVAPDAPVDTSDGRLVEFESRTAWTGSALKTESFSGWSDGTSGTNVGGTHDGDVLEYDDLTLGRTATSLSVHYVNNSSRCGTDSRIEVYLDSREGAPLVTVPLPVTGSTWSAAGTTTVTLPTVVRGTHDVILVLRTTVPDANHPFVANLDSFTFNYGVDKSGLRDLRAQYEPLLDDGARYVDVDFAMFTRTMEAAAEVLADETAVASDVSGAARDLRLAAGQLAPRALRSLQAGVAEAQELDLTRYTRESADAVSAALADARAMLTAANATDEQYLAQAGALESAVQELELEAATAPDAPNAVSATASGRNLTVAWAAPTRDGNSPVTGYLVQLEGGEPVEVGAGATSYTFSGLARGREYRASVKAVNAQGVSPASAYTAYVPIASLVPTAPAKPGISAVGQAVTVTWSAPDDGGATITGYVVRLSDGTEVEVPGSPTEHTFTGLAAGDYSASVAAVNVNGRSSFSRDSVTATVLEPPTVTRVSATAPSWSRVDVRWTAGGSQRCVLQVILRQGGRVVGTRQAWSDAAGVSFTGLVGATTYQASVAPLGGTSTVSGTVRTPSRPKVASHAVQIRGKAKVGRTLSVTLHAGSWSPGTRFTYQWRSGGKVIGTGARLRLPGRLAGARVTVRVTGRHGDWTPTTVTSGPVRVTR